MTRQQAIDMFTAMADEHNPSPCHPDLCGIDGVPCQRCQMIWFTPWLADRMVEVGPSLVADPCFDPEKQPENETTIDPWAYGA